MTDIIKAVFDTIAAYAGDGRYFILALICLVVLLFDKRLRALYGYPTLILGFVLVNPVLLYRLSNGILKDARIYKLYLALPLFLMISYGFTKLSKKNYIFALLIALLVITGTPVTSGFESSQNAYKISDDVIIVCDEIESLAKEKGIPEEEPVKAAVAEGLVTEVRQYDGRIVLEYGRRPKKTDNSPRAKTIAKLMNEEVIDSVTLAKKTKKDICDFLVISAEKGITGDFAGGIYVPSTATENYIIYERK